MMFYHDADARLRISNVLLNTVSFISVGCPRVESISGVPKFEDIDKSSRSENNSRQSPIAAVYVVSSVF